MKFNEQWLHEWVNPPVNTDDLANQLTMAGLEVEQLTSLSGQLQGVVVGEILSVEPHPNADKLRICQVNIGQDKPLTLVSAAQNVRPHLRVPVACLESTLFDGTKIKRAKLRGIESEGMMCSAKELGRIESAEGLLELPATAPLGEDIRTYLQLNDHVFEIKLTPNRGDCLSVMGIAREVAVLNQCTFTVPKIESVTPKIDEVYSIAIKDPAACPRYYGRIIRNVNMATTTPTWLQERLVKSGLRAINPVVDVMNYVMLELGQPMHAFDLAKINGDIQVRLSSPAEKLTLLDGEDIVLEQEALVIADNNHALAIAGIMGGLSSAVSDQTQHIFLESAHFTPQIIAKSARHYHLTTDASMRFERGVDPTLPQQAMERATALLLNIAGGEPGPMISVEFADQLCAKAPIKFRPSRVEQMLGIIIPEGEMLAILQRLGAEVKKTEGAFFVTPPSYRFDMTIEEDLIEEIARIHGYANIPASPLRTGITVPQRAESDIPLDRFTNCLIDRGYHEVITYSFVDPILQQRLFPNQETLSLVNPISSELAQMRLSLWPGLITAVQHNQRRQQANMRLFEVGLRFVDNLQQPVLAGILAGSVGVDAWNVSQRDLDFYDVKADLEALTSLSKQMHWVYTSAEHPTLHPRQAAKIEYDGQVLGWLGALHPAILQSLELTGPIFLFEIQLDLLTQGKLPKYQSLSKFPFVRRDLSFIVADDITAQHIRQAIFSLNNECLQDLYFFDVYKGKGIESGKKSIAIGLILQHGSRTLVDAEVNSYVEQVIAKLVDQFQVKIRDA